MTEIKHRETASQTCPHCDTGLFAPDYEWRKHQNKDANSEVSLFHCIYCDRAIGIVRTVVAYYEFDVVPMPEEPS